MEIDRRLFLNGGIAAAVAGSLCPANAMPTATAPSFHTDDQRWQNAYDRALLVLASNVQTVPRFSGLVLIEGAAYRGIWMESGPHEALVYRKFRPDVARQSHLAFFALQRANGQLPANNKVSETGFGQIQMVVPIAATAWDLARATGDDELLREAYVACAAWEKWLSRYRNTRNTGLIEGFCTYDTGQDNSPRWAGMPVQCPNKDASRFAPVTGLPRLCPDLSATSYGARVALSDMARALGRDDEADRWGESAAELRALILSRLYVPQDAAFYDLDAQDNFIRIDCSILMRVCGEHVPDQGLFDTLWRRQIHDPDAFWPRYPLPSVAIGDPRFVRPSPANSWGGASQALTALRAGRWFDHYHRSAELGELMERWCEAIQRDTSFRQQIDPLTGAFTQQDAPGYSPTALLMVDFTWRLAGVRDAGDLLHWNICLGHPAFSGAQFSVKTDAGQTAEIRYEAGGASLSLGGKPLARITGGAARLVTDQAGVPLHLVGIARERQHVRLAIVGGGTERYIVAPNATVLLACA